MFDIRFVIASHGRQGTTSLQEGFSVLEKIHVPYYSFTDQALLSNNWEPLLHPVDDYSAQSLIPSLNYQQDYGLIHHSFTNIHHQAIFTHLAQVIKQDTPVFLFARNPYDNLISCYNTYLFIFFCYQLRPNGASNLSYLKLLDTDSPLSFSDYCDSQYLIGDYLSQLKIYERIGMRPIVRNFSSLNNIREAIRDILTELNLDDPAIEKVPVSLKNHKYDHIFNCLFAPRNRFNINGVRLEVGFFPEMKQSPFQMSFEIPIAPSYFVNPMQWYKLPIQTRSSIIADPNAFDLLHITKQRYMDLKNKVDSAMSEWCIELEDKKIIQFINKKIGASIHEFARKYSTIAQEIHLT